MIVAAAVCPHPPLLVPEIAPGTDAELGGLRAACRAAVAGLVASGAGRILVIGAGGLAHDVDEHAGGSLAGFGVDVRAGGDDLVLPPSLTIGAWLLDAAGWSGPRTYSTGAPDTSGDVALLVMADGSNGRSEKAPGFLDERAEPFDAAIARALADGDPAALVALDADLGAALGSTGVPALQNLGHAVGATTKGATVAARVLFDGAPLGVGYVVAEWLPTGRTA
ncbi:hypothetical protein IFT73_03935 [Aeromicrobium sp. CFBP 8757]|uniref:hypothetical protein n=1 Tax=Aeromicrobium sp. CFBP 8757 TaxID=2775288 RepID=UPI001786B32B|nr:hypothetical protein [Aeromicrobium sp. CFBP 8757]